MSATQAQLKTYHKEENKNNRLSHRDLILKVFTETEQEFTVRGMAGITGLPYNACQSRISELTTDTLLAIAGEKKESGNANSLFKINTIPSMLNKKKMTKLELMKLAIKKCLIIYHPKIMR